MSNAFPISYGPFTNSFILLVSEYGGVVWIEDAAGSYQVPILYAAMTLCKARNMFLATRFELEEARKLGFDNCKCGWLADGTVGLPIVTPTKQCGGGPPRTMMCPEDPWNGIGWDAYCTKGKHIL